MARGTFTDSTNYLYRASAPVTTTPLSMACWFYTTSMVTDDRTPVSLSVYTGGGVTRNGHILMFETSHIWALTRRDSSTSAGSDFGYSATQNQWNFLGGVFAASNSRKCYYNTSVAAENTTDLTPNGTINRMTVGGMMLSGGAVWYAYPGNTYVAHVAIWNAALTDTDMYSLAKKASPLLIKPENLVVYCPLTRGNASGDEIDLVSGVTLTEVGTVGVVPAINLYMAA